MTVVMYNFDRAHVFCVCSYFLRTTAHAYTREPITLPELSLKIRVFELGSFHWKLDFRAQGALALIRPPTNFAAHGAPWARILNHVVGSFWLDSVLLTEGSILIDLGSNFVKVNSIAEIIVSWVGGKFTTPLARHFLLVVPTQYY